MALPQLSMIGSHVRSKVGPMLLLVLLAGCIQLPGPAYAQSSPTPSSPDLSAIPDACLNAGSELQTQCAETLNEAQSFFNVQVGPNGQPAPGTPQITQAQIDAYVAQAPAPTPACCKAACDFNANFCSCEKGVLNFAVQLTANDPHAYKSVALGFAQACQFRIYYGPSCPPKAQQASITPVDLKECAALPPPTSAGQARGVNATAANATRIAAANASTNGTAAVTAAAGVPQTSG